MFRPPWLGITKKVGNQDPDAFVRHVTTDAIRASQHAKNAQPLQLVSILVVRVGGQWLWTAAMKAKRR